MDEKQRFFTRCRLDRPDNICFWLLLPISVVVWFVDWLF